MIDANPHLAAGRHAHDDKGTEAGIEQPDRVVNVAWQTRKAAPTDAESALADALQTIFGEEIYELPRIVERLNRIGLAAPAGAAQWTEEGLRARLGELGR